MLWIALNSSLYQLPSELSFYWKFYNMGDCELQRYLWSSVSYLKTYNLPYLLCCVHENQLEFCQTWSQNLKKCLQNLSSVGTLRRTNQYYYMQGGHLRNHTLHNNPENHLIKNLFFSLIKLIKLKHSLNSSKFWCYTLCDKTTGRDIIHKHLIFCLEVFITICTNTS